MDKDEFLLKRIRELANLSYQRDIVTFTDFLNLNEQNMLVSLKLHQIGVEVKLFGGYEHAERQMAAFSRRPWFSWDYPIDCLKIEPKALRFSEELGHRDYLGALLNLGVDRSVVGDILIKDKEAWFFCLHKMSDFFIENLIRVKHTTVLVFQSRSRQNEIPEPEFEMTNGTCASVRLDALIGLAFQTSRSSMVSFIENGQVFVNGKLITSNGYEPKEGDIISVRGKGRFIFDGVSRQTKKGRNSVKLRRYQ